MSEPIHIISDGGGVQSSYLKDAASKGAFGDIPIAAVFADTKEEPASVYRWLESQRQTSKIRMETVSSGDLADASLQVARSKNTGNMWMKGLIPAFIKNPDGTRGILGRSCTFDFKIKPVRKFLRSLLGDALPIWRKIHKRELAVLSEWQEAKRVAKKLKQPSPMRPDVEWQKCQEDAPAILWLGISSDEAGRAKESGIPWIRHRHPLLEIEASRSHCSAGIPGAPRTACKFCPFHNDFEWQRLKDEEPEEFNYAIKYEQRLQESATRGGLRGIPYLHDSLKPLSEVVFNASPDRQLNLFNNDCEGMCGV